MSERQAPPGWYPVEGGKQRYWDGSGWTEHFADAKQVTTAKTEGSPGRIQNAASTAAHRFASADVDVPEGTLWHAIGKGMGGIVTGRYRMDIYYLYAAKGALRTDAQQVPIAQVVDVDVRQTMTQKARGVYTVLVHVNHQGRLETMRIDDIVDGPGAQRVINETARNARLMLEHRNIQIEGLRHQATSTVRQEIAYEGLSGSAPRVVPTQATPFLQAAAFSGPSAEDPDEIQVEAIEQAHKPDPIAQLRELGSLRDAGILTEEEFAAKKVEILKRL